MPDLIRPSVAIISNSQTPYRLHLHQRIAWEIPEIKLWSLFTHELIPGANWKLTAPEEIRPVLFGENGSAKEPRLLKNAFQEWEKGGRIIRWMREHQVVAIILHGYNDPGRLRILRWCTKNGRPCFLSGDSNIRGDNATGLKRWLKRILLRRVVRLCSGVLPCGTLGRAYFRRYGASDNQIFFFPCEPDYELIQRLPEEMIEQMRRRFNLAAGRRRIIFSARMISIKRADLLLDAFAKISDDRPLWELVMVGDGPLRPALMEQVPQRLRSRVTWTGFLDDQSAVSALYRLSDVLVLPSDRDAWALVINEAAAAGLAIISSDVVGAAAELVIDGVNGRVFPHGDLEVLIHCLLEVTAEDRIDTMKAASAKVLADWRTKADPVEGLRKALQSVAVLS